GVPESEGRVIGLGREAQEERKSPNPQLPTAKRKDRGGLFWELEVGRWELITSTCWEASSWLPEASDRLRPCRSPVRRRPAPWSTQRRRPASNRVWHGRRRDDPELRSSPAASPPPESGTSPRRS